MTVDQLDDEVLKLKKEQFNLRFQRATGQLENTSRVRVIRRDIARIKTIARQKRVGEPAPKRAAEPKQSRRRSVPREEPEVEVEVIDAEAYAPRRRGERQTAQDGGGARGAPLHPSDAEEDRAADEEIPRPRRDQRICASATWCGSRSIKPISKLKRWTVVRGEKKKTANVIAQGAQGK